MVTTKRRGSKRQAARNNNPEGNNQYSNGWTSSARENPLTTAAAIGGAVAAGVFLWSRRNQISDQIGQLGEQIGDWRATMRPDDQFGSDPFIASDKTARRSNRKTQQQFAEEALTLKETGKAEIPAI